MTRARPDGQPPNSRSRRHDRPFAIGSARPRADFGVRAAPTLCVTSCMGRSTITISQCASTLLGGAARSGAGAHARCQLAAERVGHRSCVGRDRLHPDRGDPAQLLSPADGQGRIDDVQGAMEQRLAEPRSTSSALREADEDRRGCRVLPGGVQRPDPPPERRRFDVLLDLGRDADVLVVNRDNPVCASGLSLAQARGIAPGHDHPLVTGGGAAGGPARRDRSSRPRRERLRATALRHRPAAAPRRHRAGRRGGSRLPRSGGGRVLPAQAARAVAIDGVVDDARRRLLRRYSGPLRSRPRRRRDAATRSSRPAAGLVNCRSARTAPGCVLTRMPARHSPLPDDRGLCGATRWVTTRRWRAPMTA